MKFARAVVHIIVTLLASVLVCINDIISHLEHLLLNTSDIEYNVGHHVNFIIE
jgi:hypothetical protein